MTQLPVTLPPEIPALLDAFAEGATTALGPRLVALYLFGSALSDDFAPATSDLDFLGVLADRPTLDDLAALAGLHRRLAADASWGGRLEGGYAARDALRPWGIDGRIAAVGPEDGFQPDVPSDYSADNVAALRASGLVLVGPPASEVVPEVDRATLEAGLRDYLAELLARSAHSDSAVDARELDARELSSWALNVARCLYGIETGRTSTKREAAAWLAARAPSVRDVLDAALDARAGAITPEAASALRDGRAVLAEVASRWSVG